MYKAGGLSGCWKGHQHPHCFPLELTTGLKFLPLLSKLVRTYTCSWKDEHIYPSESTIDQWAIMLEKRTGLQGNETMVGKFWWIRQLESHYTGFQIQICRLRLAQGEVFIYLWWDMSNNVVTFQIKIVNSEVMFSFLDGIMSFLLWNDCDCRWRFCFFLNVFT